MNPLINKICSRSLDFFVCESALYNDPRSGDADLAGMGIISLDLTSKNFTDTSSFIKVLNDSTSDSDMKKVLRYCSVAYNNGLDAIDKATDSLNSKDYENFNEIAVVAPAEAVQCERAFVRSPIKSPLTQRNQNAKLLGDIIVSVSILLLDQSSSIP
ncbi:Pectinesterase inhibitor [Melia azedarach]|uniref:Pectinesterase inhibitor n=1 Tax=Melia azedarach TaxID=155640 RepID=A0ACC1YBA0_MELAZ|nr:Pectinesterase inhibitor [Melia azedarach]